jgi:integrase
MRAKKVDQSLRVPLSPRAKAWITSKPLDFIELLPALSEACSTLKKIGELAGLTEVIYFSGHEGRMRVELSAKKHDLIGTHTARRTFVTLCLSQGMRPETVMRITGHKNFQTMMRYVAITRKDTAEEIARAWR